MLWIIHPKNLFSQFYFHFSSLFFELDFYINENVICMLHMTCQVVYKVLSKNMEDGLE